MSDEERLARRQAMAPAPWFRLTEPMARFMEAAGCRPLACHACGEPLQVGAPLGVWSGPQSLLVHADCRDRPELVLSHGPEEAARVRQWMARASEVGFERALAEPLEPPTRGCATTASDLAAMGLVPPSEDDLDQAEQAAWAQRAYDDLVRWFQEEDRA